MTTLRSALRKLWKLFVACSVLFAIASLFAAATPFVPWFARVLAGHWTDASGDILIVLGNDGEPDGLVGQGSYWRCVYAVRAWREGHFQRIVVSGGPIQGSRFTIAGTMRDFMVSSGVPRDVIFVEERSTSTRENALFTKEMIAGWPGKKVLLTSDLHMYRACRVFRAIGLDVSPHPVPDSIKGSRTWGSRWMHSFGLGVECVKIVYYAARGWI